MILFFLGGGESSASDLTCVFICLSCAYLVPYLIDFHATATTTEFHTTCSSTLQSKSFLPPTTTTVSFLFCCGLPMKKKKSLCYLYYICKLLAVTYRFGFLRLDIEPAQQQGQKDKGEKIEKKKKLYEKHRKSQLLQGFVPDWLKAFWPHTFLLMPFIYYLF